MYKTFNKLFLLLPILQIQSSLSQKISHHDDDGMRIVGGDSASPGEFPYQVFIENVFNTSEILKCGGAIYSQDYIITAAHCMYFKDTQTYANPKRIWITAGTTDLEEGPNSSKGDVNKFKQIARVSEIIPHPKFQYKRFEGALGNQPIYDIALLKVNPPLKMNERTQPISLAPEGYMVQGNGTVTGWGRPDPYGKWTKQMRKVDIPLVDWEPCANLFKGYAVVSEDMFCTGTKEGGQTPCNGDSGGPVACRLDGDPAGPAFLCGVASFGPSRCPNYSVYTRVSNYVQWIKEVTEKRM